MNEEGRRPRAGQDRSHVWKGGDPEVVEIEALARTLEASPTTGGRRFGPTSLRRPTRPEFEETRSEVLRTWPRGTPKGDAAARGLDELSRKWFGEGT